MAGKISEMTPAGTLTGSEEIEVVQGGSNVRSTTGAIAALVEIPDPPDPPVYTGALTAVNQQTGTSYTLQASDAGALVVLTNASDVTVNVGTALAAKDVVDIMQGGDGAVTVVGAGATLLSTNGTKLKKKNSLATLRMLSGSTGLLTGDLEPGDDPEPGDEVVLKSGEIHSFTDTVPSSDTSLTGAMVFKTAITQAHIDALGGPVTNFTVRALSATYKTGAPTVRWIISGDPIVSLDPGAQTNVYASGNQTAGTFYAFDAAALALAAGDVYFAAKADTGVVSFEVSPCFGANVTLAPGVGSPVPYWSGLYFNNFITVDLGASPSSVSVEVDSQWWSGSTPPVTWQATPGGVAFAVSEGIVYEFDPSVGSIELGPATGASGLNYSGLPNPDGVSVWSFYIFDVDESSPLLDVKTFNLTVSTP